MAGTSLSKEREVSGLGRRGLEDAVAGGALRIARGQLRAQAVDLRAEVVDDGLVLAAGVPLHERGADALQRAAAALVERVGLAGGILEHRLRGRLDALRVVGREVDQ